MKAPKLNEGEVEIEGRPDQTPAFRWEGQRRSSVPPAEGPARELSPDQRAAGRGPLQPFRSEGRPDQTKPDTGIPLERAAQELSPDCRRSPTSWLS